MTNKLNLFEAIKYDSASEESFSMKSKEYHTAAVVSCKDAGKIVLALGTANPNISLNWSYNGKK